MMDTIHEIWTGPCVIVCEDGTVIQSKQSVTRWDDWRDTAFGKINFGKTILGHRWFERQVP